MIRLSFLGRSIPFLLPLLVACSSGGGSGTGGGTTTTTGAGGDSNTSSTGGGGAGGGAAVGDSITCFGPCPKAQWARTLSGEFEGDGRGLVALAGDDTVVAYFAKYGGKLAGGPTPEPELSWDAAIVTYGADQSVKRRLDFEDVLELDAMSVGPDGSIALLLEGRSDTELSYQGKTLPGFTGSGGLLVVKPDGSLGWTKSSYARNPTLAFGADGSLYIAGRVSEANGVYDGVVEKYDPSGVQAWVKTIKTGAPNNETVSGMAITPGGDVFVAGYHQKPITIDGASLEGSDTAWIAKLAASDGTAVWAADVDGMHEPRVSLLGSDPVLVGESTIARFSGSAAGKAIWSTQILGAVPVAIAGDATHLVITGTFKEGTIFPFGTLLRRADNPTGTGAFVAEMDANGAFTRGFSVLPLTFLNTTGDVTSLAIATSGARTVLAGKFENAADFGFGRVEMQEANNEFALSFGWP